MQKRQTIIAGLMVALLILSYESKGAALLQPPSTGKFLIFMHKAVE